MEGTNGNTGRGVARCDCDRNHHERRTAGRAKEEQPPSAGRMKIGVRQETRWKGTGEEGD